MSHISSRKFCCCLPVRVGVIIIATIGLVGSGFVAIAGAVSLPHTSGSTGALRAEIILYSILAFLSALGLVGAIAKMRKLVAAYGAILFVHLCLSIGTNIYFLWRLFQYKQKAIDDCMSDPGNNNPTRESCEKSGEIGRGIMVGIVIAVWLVEIWFCLIVNDYRRQLKEEEAGMAKDIERR